MLPWMNAIVATSMIVMFHLGLVFLAEDRSLNSFQSLAEAIDDAAAETGFVPAAVIQA